MKESLEAGAEGRNTHVHTLRYTCTHDMNVERHERGDVTETRVHLGVSLHIITCWVRVD